MKTVVLGPRPEELEALIKKRQALGIDGYDEVWEGDYHVAPMARSDQGHVQAMLLALLGPKALERGLHPYGPFNLGEPDNFRVPDGGFFREPVAEVYVPTAAIVIEVVSPNDETYDKFGFYARHGVDEIIVADPQDSIVRCFLRQGGQYVETKASELLGVTTDDMAAAVRKA